jgi:hypothetical protein
MKLLIMQFSPASPQITSSAPCSQTPIKTTGKTVALYILIFAFTKETGRHSEENGHVSY